MTREELREELADLAHEVWAGWWRYQSTFGQTTPNSSMLLAGEKVTRWSRQARTPYEDLTEQEKQSDREIADRYMEIMDAYLAKTQQSLKSEGYWNGKIESDTLRGD